MEIRAAEFTTSDVGDAPMLPELLDQIPPDQEIASVTADGAFDTRKCHDAIAARGVAAIIPPRRNAKPWKPDTPGAIARNEALRASRRFGRTIWRRWSGYHRRSRVETKMHCVKLLGQRLMARDFDRRVAEFQVRVAVLNGFTAFGTPITRSWDKTIQGKGWSARYPICATEPATRLPHSGARALVVFGNSSGPDTGKWCPIFRDADDLRLRNLGYWICRAILVRMQMDCRSLSATV